jgi:hypothetical protein
MCDTFHAETSEITMDISGLRDERDRSIQALRRAYDVLSERRLEIVLLLGDVDLSDEMRSSLEQDSMRLGAIMLKITELNETIIKAAIAAHRPILVLVK